MRIRHAFILASTLLAAQPEPAPSCEILVKATSVAHPDPVKDRRGRMKKGMPVVIMPDGHVWGDKERLPAFYLIKIPDISVERVRKYIDAQFEADGQQIYRARRWQIRVEDLPVGARNKLASTGVLTIKATADYGGTYDYTWSQVRGYFRNLETGMDETENP